jgi:NAD(P)H dehydrogenase (quinone)
VAGWVSSYRAIAAGELEVVSDDVERITGKAPFDLSEWLRAHPDSWRHLAA